MATAILETETPTLAHLDADAAKFYEVVDGQIRENPPMGARESILASFLLALMDPFVRPTRLGRLAVETLFWIDRARKLKRRPDVAFVSSQRWSLKREVPDTETWDVVPDLAVEVVSESNSANEVVRKIDEYFQAGVSQVWAVYQITCKVYVYDSPTRVRILQRGDQLDCEGLIPAFRVSLSTLFARDDDFEAADGTE